MLHYEITQSPPRCTIQILFGLSASLILGFTWARECVSSLPVRVARQVEGDRDGEKATRWEVQNANLMPSTLRLFVRACVCVCACTCACTSFGKAPRDLLIWQKRTFLIWGVLNCSQSTEIWPAVVWKGFSFSLILEITPQISHTCTWGAGGDRGLQLCVNVVSLQPLCMFGVGGRARVSSHIAGPGSQETQEAIVWGNRSVISVLYLWPRQRWMQKFREFALPACVLHFFCAAATQLMCSGSSSGFTQAPTDLWRTHVASDTRCLLSTVHRDMHY